MKLIRLNKEYAVQDSVSNVLGKVHCYHTCEKCEDLNIFFGEGGGVTWPQKSMWLRAPGIVHQPDFLIVLVVGLTFPVIIR